MKKLERGLSPSSSRAQDDSNYFNNNRITKLRSISTLDFDAFEEERNGERRLKVFTTDDLQSASQPVNPTWIDRPCSFDQSHMSDRAHTQRSWYPDHLAKVRSKTIKKLRPYLETLNAQIAVEFSGSKNEALLLELKRIVLTFLVTSEEELQKGKCKKFILDVQNAQKTLGTKFASDSIENDLIIKLLFILATYSRVQEYINSVSSYMV